MALRRLMRGSNLCGGHKRPLRSEAPNAVCQAHMHRLAQRGARQLLGTCLADLCEEMMAKRQGRALKRQVRCLNYSASLIFRKTVTVSIRGHNAFRLRTQVNSWQHSMQLHQTCCLLRSVLSGGPVKTLGHRQFRHTAACGPCRALHLSATPLPKVA